MFALCRRTDHLRTRKRDCHRCDLRVCKFAAACLWPVCECTQAMLQAWLHKIRDASNNSCFN